MTKTALLKNSTAVEIVAQLPAKKPQRQYADFDAFVANADKLVAFKRVSDGILERLDDLDFEWLEWSSDRRSLNLEQAKDSIRRAKIDVQSATHALGQIPQARKRLAEFKRDEQWYNREELYDIRGKGKKAQSTLSRRVVAEQIGLLLASFQNSRPGTPKVFGKMVVEEVHANNPNACVLESACRHVRRNQNFPPSIAEMLKAIERESEAWSARWQMLDDDDNLDAADFLQHCLKDAIAEAEGTIGKAQAKLAEFEAAEAKRIEQRAKAEADRRAEQERREAAERERAERKKAADAEWVRRHDAANACRGVHPELWDAVTREIAQSLPPNETICAAGGLSLYIAQVVRSRLMNQ